MQGSFLAFYIGSALLVTGCGDQATVESSDVGSNAVADAAQPPVGKADAPVTQQAAHAADPKLAIESEGLRLFNPDTGAARPLPFGQPRERMLAALAFRGPPGTGTNADCGVDYANWPDGLGLHFQNGNFVGWTLDARGEGTLSTASGIAPGSTRRDLDDAYAARHDTSTLGEEFNAGGIAGLLDGKGPDAKITNMWAGVSCVAR